MRRLWAYILTAFTALVAVGATFVNVLTKTQSNIEYQEGREITFNISEREDVDDAAAVTREGTLKIAKEMERRLKQYKATSYKVIVCGDDQIKVQVSQETSEDYTYLANYLSFNGNLALSYGNDYVTADEFLVPGKEAYQTVYKNSASGVESLCLILPVNVDSSEFTSLLGKAQDAAKNGENEFAEESSQENADGESETIHTHYMYLWYDFVEGKCTFEATQDSSDPYNANVLMKFQVSDKEEGSEEYDQFYPDGENNKFYSAVRIDTNSDGFESVSEKEKAYKQIAYFVNLINAGKLDYKVENVYSQVVSVPSTIEPLVDYSSDGYHLVAAWSNTLIATICAIVVLSFLFVVYYRLGAISIATLSISSAYVGLLSVLLFKAEFNTFGIIGLAIVALASIVSGVIYCQKLKEECYRGRSLKKANTEAAKKALLPIVDVNVIAIVIGVFVYIFGGAIVRNFAVVTVFGGIASLILNTLGLRGMMWLATNTTSLVGKYEAFGVNSENVPNIINEEKQKYYGAYADSDFTKKKTPVGIAALVLLLAGVTGLGVFGGLAAAGKGELYPVNEEKLYSTITFETKNDSSEIKKEAVIQEILENLICYQDSKKDGTVLPDEAKESGDGHIVGSVLELYVPYTTTNEEKNYIFKHYDRVETEDAVEVTYFYYVVELKSDIPEAYSLAYKNGSVYDPAADNETFITAAQELLDHAVDLFDSSDKTKVSIRPQEVYTESTVNFWGVALGVAIAVVVLATYFVLRYRPSRGIVSLIFALSVSAIAVGVFALFRNLSIGSYIAAAIPMVAAFVMMASVILMNRERELIVEDKAHDSSVENRNEIMVKATSSAFNAILPFGIFALYLAINFFGFGPSATAWIWVSIIIGILVGTLVVTTLYGPIAQFFYKLFYRGQSSKPKKAKKAKVAKVNKSAEPEEAVFIGIND